MVVDLGGLPPQFAPLAGSPAQLAAAPVGFECDPYAGVTTPEGRAAVDAALKGISEDLSGPAPKAQATTAQWVDQPDIRLEHPVPQLPAPQPQFKAVYDTPFGEFSTKYRNIVIESRYLILVSDISSDGFTPRAGAAEPGSELSIRVSGPQLPDTALLAYHIGIVFELFGFKVMVLVITQPEAVAMEKRAVVSPEYSPRHALSEPEVFVASDDLPPASTGGGVDPTDTQIMQAVQPIVIPSARAASAKAESDE